MIKVMDMVEEKKLLELLQKITFFNHMYLKRFRSSNDNNGVGGNIYAFDIGFQEYFKAAQPIKIEFNLDAVVPAGIYSYASVLTNRLVDISLDGQRKFDLT